MATLPMHVVNRFNDFVQDTDFQEWMEKEVAVMNTNSSQCEASTAMYAGSYRVEVKIINEDNSDGD